MTTEITIPARRVEDADDCLAAAIEIVAADMSIDPEWLSARWDDERQRDAVIVTLPRHMDPR